MGYNIDIDIDYEKYLTHVQASPSPGSHHDAITSALLTTQVNMLLEIEAIEQCSHSSNEYISPIFLVSKTDGSYRKILNLKSFNQYIKYEHFKMENLNSALSLITPNCYMTSIDLMKAYYSVPVAKASRKYLRFEWNGALYQYKALPNGLASAPRIFTRVMKTLFAVMREQGCECIMYLDDSLFMADSVQKCISDTNSAMEILNSAGFYINRTKSVVQPTQEIKFLGFTINSVEMKIYLPRDKKLRLKHLAESLLAQPVVTVEKLAQVIGTIVAYLPAFVYGKLHYRGLEVDKIETLKTGSYKSKLNLSNCAKNDLHWWTDNVQNSGAPIKPLEYTKIIYTDASLTGYGAVYSTMTMGAEWPSDVLSRFGANINCLEMLAVLYALKYFCSYVENFNVCVKIDNTTAVSYINQMGGTHSKHCNDLAIDIWNFAIKHNIMLKASHIPGIRNEQADFASRHHNQDIELALRPQVYTNLCKCFGLNPVIDLFASSLNHKVDSCYVSWKPDSHATYIDAFSLDWNNFNCVYIFPPFSLWGRVLAKLQATTNLQAVVIFPKWPGQFWFPALMKLVQDTVELNVQDLVEVPHRLKKLRLLSGKILPNHV